MRGVATAKEGSDIENTHLDQLTTQRKERLIGCASSRDRYLQEFSEINSSVDHLKDAVKNPLKLDSSKITGDNNLRELFTAAVERGSEQDAVSIINRAIKYYELQLDFLQRSFIDGLSRQNTAHNNPTKTRTRMGNLFRRVLCKDSGESSETVKPAFSLSTLREGDTFLGQVQTSKAVDFHGRLTDPVDFSKNPRIIMSHFFPGQVITVSSVVPERDAITFYYSKERDGRVTQRECAFNTDEFLHFVGASEA